MSGKAKNLCIIQARLSSTRLPGKVLLKVNGQTLLEHEISRVRRAKKINKIVVATGLNNKNEKILALCKKIKIDCFRGSEDDVLDRFYQCASHYSGYKNIIRLTGDCPLIDPEIIDQVIDFYEQGKFDYATNSCPPETHPDGMDVEIFSRAALKQAALKAKLASEREHVTLYIKKHDSFKKGGLTADHNWSQIRLTVDNPEDFAVVNFLIKHSRPDASYLDYISLLTAYPEWLLKNKHIKRNEGLVKSLKKDFNYASAKNYKVLKKNVFITGPYSLVPLRQEDMALIRIWRNQQIKILRQNKVLSKDDQYNYYQLVIKPLFSAKLPEQILFSFILKGRCIGYGGLVHIDWQAKRAEVSFLLATARINNKGLYKKEFNIFLDLIKEIAFKELKFNRLFTETFDVRPLHLAVLESNGFRYEGRLKQHVKINNRLVDSLIHGCLKKTYVK